MPLLRPPRKSLRLTGAPRGRNSIFEPPRALSWLRKRLDQLVHTTADSSPRQWGGQDPREASIFEGRTRDFIPECCWRSASQQEWQEEENPHRRAGKGRGLMRPGDDALFMKDNRSVANVREKTSRPSFWPGDDFPNHGLTSCVTWPLREAKIG